MSIVACRVSDKEIWWAADSIVCSGWTKIEKGTKYSKLLDLENGVIIGGAGPCEELSLLLVWARNHLPGGNSADDIAAWMVEFATYKKANFDKLSLEGGYLIGWQGAAYMAVGFSAIELSTYAAVGAGEDFALAILHAGGSPVEAVEAAIALSPFCSGPIIEAKMKR